MKNIKLLALGCLTWVSLFTSSILWAHTDLSAAVPADGAVMNQSPEKISLTFTEEVKLLKVSLMNSNDEAIETDFVPSATAGEQFAVALPNLSEDTYTLEWAVLGSDSHRVEGELSFTLNSTAQEVSGGEGEESHAEHHED